MVGWAWRLFTWLKHHHFPPALCFFQCFITHSCCAPTNVVLLWYLSSAETLGNCFLKALSKNYFEVCQYHKTTVVMVYYQTGKTCSVCAYIADEQVFEYHSWVVMFSLQVLSCLPQYQVAKLRILLSTVIGVFFCYLLLKEQTGSARFR